MELTVATSYSEHLVVTDLAIVRVERRSEEELRRASAIVLVVGGVAGLSVGVFARVLVFTLAEAIVLPAAATGASQLFKRKSEPSTAQAWLSRDPRSPVTWVIPTGEVSF